MKSEKDPNPASCPMSRYQALLVAIFLASLNGCGTFGGGSLTQQLRDENQRLVSEFRAQQKANDSLREQNRKLEDRLAESEKLLARSQPNSAARISSRPLPRSFSGESQPGLPPAGPTAGDNAANGLLWQPRN
ncbi:MAG TPA: hypothetical protein DDW52_22245 [Planctomycetaceae bacterium]|nr:hypothetical protein [Planctomycetaceae bacterium]